MLTLLLAKTGFGDIELHSHDPIAKAQRKNAYPRNRLRTFVHRRFILTCRRPTYLLFKTRYEPAFHAGIS